MTATITFDTDTYDYWIDDEDNRLRIGRLPKGAQVVLDISLDNEEEVFTLKVTEDQEIKKSIRILLQSVYIIMDAASTGTPVHPEDAKNCMRALQKQIEAMDWL